MIIDNKFPNGIRFEGTDGWIFVTRGEEKVTASDPGSSGAKLGPLNASKEEILNTPLGEKEIHLHGFVAVKEKQGLLILSRASPDVALGSDD